MKTLILVIATIFVLSFQLANHADAKCMVDKDWPDKPCIDTYPPLPLSKSEWKNLWNAYYDFKGVQWMEQKKLELDKQVNSGTLLNWIESGSSTQNFTNYNVWFYYYVNGKAPAPPGYELADQNSQPVSSDASIFPKLGEEFKLGQDEVAFFKLENILIKFSNVTEDSRCPTGVVCIWQGRVSVDVNVIKDDKDKGNFILTLGENEKLALQTFDGYSIKLLKVEPYPSFPNNNTGSREYIISLSVSKEKDIVTIDSPLKQFKSGTSNQDVKCKENLELVIKASDGSPACVKPKTKIKLIQRGWADVNGPLIYYPGINSDVFVTLKEGDREGSLLVEKIFQDSVNGLNFLDYPVARDTGYPITLHLGDTASNGCTVEMTLVRIQGNTAIFLKKEHNDRPCPICLSGDTVIDTPNGAINVKELKEGMAIFTQDESGNKYIGTILKTGKTMVSPTHKMVHILLADNRELYVSPNHPTADGRLVGELSIGDTLDGSKIKNAELVLYHGTDTYDILPSSQTGFYWANGILIKSTLN